MLHVSPILATILLSCTRTISAEFNDFFFASNATRYVCPGTGFACPPPNICSHEAIADVYYCCMPGATDAVCWKGSPSCDGDDERTPSGSQQSCSSGNNAFCCLKSREECTQTNNQVNVCWSTAENPVANLSDTKLNDTFSSLSSARPSASSFPVSLAQLQASATPTTSLPILLPASSLSSAVETASGSPTSSATNPPSSAEASNEGGISGGAIGGIVGGVVGGLALIGIAGLLFWRRRKANSKGDHAPIASEAPSEHEENRNPYELNAVQAQHAGMAEAPVPTEKYRYNAAAGGYTDVPEVMGSPTQNVYEMSGSAPAEMDASATVRRT